LQIQTKRQLLGWQPFGQIRRLLAVQQVGSGENNASKNRKPDQGRFPTGEVQHVALGLAQRTNLCGVAPCAAADRDPCPNFAAIP
jgi:hypothetical protein